MARRVLGGQLNVEGQEAVEQRRLPIQTPCEDPARFEFLAFQQPKPGQEPKDL
jgi:hypothetical protein